VVVCDDNNQLVMLGGAAFHVGHLASLWVEVCYLEHQLRIAQHICLVLALSVLFCCAVGLSRDLYQTVAVSVPCVLGDRSGLSE
jgi:hypothetical protein